MDNSSNFLFCLLLFDMFSFGPNSPHFHQSQKTLMFASSVQTFTRVILPIGFSTWVSQRNKQQCEQLNWWLPAQLSSILPSPGSCGVTQIWYGYFWYLHTTLLISSTSYFHVTTKEYFPLRLVTTLPSAVFRTITSASSLVSWHHTALFIYSMHPMLWPSEKVAQRFYSND